MIKFPSIEQFRNVIKTVRTQHDYAGKVEGEPVYKHSTPYPKLQFTGTVKLHGTNAGIVKYKDRIEFQSRENVLQLTKDNAGFMLAMKGKDLDPLFEGIDFENYIAIFGEWCGQGIQKGVAISNVPKMFVIFGCKVDDKWVPYTKHSNEQGIYNIEQFPTFKMEIDFEKPELQQNDLIDLTIKIEECCPVGKHFGFEGVGEGIVWKCDDNNDYIFKVKGEKHSVSKVTKLAAVDTVMLENISKFVDLAVTEQRLLQGIEKVKEMGKPIDQTSTGDFLRWVVTDVIKEEEDTIVKNGFDPKNINATVSKKARVWFFDYLNKN